MVSNDLLIETLVFDLKPVRRLASPVLLAAAWLALIVCIAFVLAVVYGFDPFFDRLDASLDFCASIVGSLLTAVLASVAAFELSLPDRKPGWALLPLPTVILWIGTSTVGCLGAPAAGTNTVALGGTDNCLMFILTTAMPLSLFISFLLRSSYPLRPNLTSTVCGIASAAAAATLLNFAHLHDVSAPDLMVHGVAVSLVILANVVFGNLIKLKVGFWRNAIHAWRVLSTIASFTSTAQKLQHWKEHAKDDATCDRSTDRETMRANGQGHVVRFHRKRHVESGPNRSSDS
jgi:hypothetical protein